MGAVAFPFDSMKDLKWQIISTADALETFAAQIDVTQPLYHDTETKGLRYGAVLMGQSMFQPHIGAAFVVNKTKYWDGVSLEDQRRILNPVYAQCMGVWHNAKYDFGVLRQNGFTAPELLFDTITAIHILNSDEEMNLEDYVRKHYKYPKKHFDTNIIGAKWETMLKTEDNWLKYVNGIYAGKTFLEQLAHYACEDVAWLHPIHMDTSLALKEEGLWNLWERIEKPLTHVLVDMYDAGVSIDVPFIHSLTAKAEAELVRIEQEIYTVAGAVFNIASTQQLGDLLFNKFKLPIISKTPKGAIQVNAKVLKKLVGKHPIIQLLIDHSKVDTLLTMFLRKIPMCVDADGRLRGGFNSNGTTTGRFSSANPINLQNQPNDKKFPVRKGYVARPGYKLVGLDYSQVEYRIGAHVSKDPKMCEIFLTGRDIHTEVSQSLQIPRVKAKNVNFGIWYGLQAKGLAEFIGGTKDEAQKMLYDFAAEYPYVPAYKDHVAEETHRLGYSRTLFGRRRPLPNIYSKENYVYWGACREAVNHVIQGTCADMIKLSMVRIHQFIKDSGIDARILLTVHDELIAEVREDHVQEYYANARHIMENAAPGMRVPIIADGKIMDNWFQMKDDSFNGYQLDDIFSSLTLMAA